MREIEKIPRKILICQQRQLGDVLLSTCVLPLIKEKFPYAQIDFVTEKKCAPILKNNPYISQLFTIDKQKQKKISQQKTFYKEIATYGHDLLISFQNLPRCLLLTYFSKANDKLGEKAAWYKNLFYTHVSPTHSQYSAHKKIDILQPINIKPHFLFDVKPQWFISPEEKKEAENLLSLSGLTPTHTLISLDITHKDNKRRYPPKYYAQILNTLIEKEPETQFAFLFLRQEGEEDQVKQCASLINEKALIVFPELCPSLRISAALMSNALYHIGNCSFPRHLAVALALPSSTFVGASDNTWAFPDNKYKVFSSRLPCQPCKVSKCNHGSCLTKLLPENLFEEFYAHYSMYCMESETKKTL